MVIRGTATGTRTKVPSVLAWVLLAGGCAVDPTVEIPLTPVEEELGWEKVPLSDVVAPAEEGEYRIRVEDQLEISVYQDPELDRKIPVRPDGRISFHLIGDVVVSGRTVEEVKEEIASRLARFVRQPHVTVFVQEFAGTRILVLGEVGKPGVRKVRRGARVMDALAEAEGVKTSLQGVGAVSSETGPDLERAYMIREGRILGIDFRQLIDRGDMTQNILLAEDDIIYIPSTLDNEVYVLGEVREPSTIRFRNRIGLVEALSQAGGPKENVTTGGVVIVRDATRSPKAYRVSLGDILDGSARDVPLQRGDIVYVSPSALDSLVDVSGKIQVLLQTILAGRQAKGSIETWSESDRK